jgi:ATP-dependent Clp endopeptidase proteolytic subunit ClpP
VPKPVEILLYSEIYDDSAQDYINQIRAAGSSPILLRISCPGGSVFAGNAIYNALLAHKPGVTATIDSLAASMATIIMLAASKITMAANAMIMIHKASGGAWGGADELRRTAALLDSLDKTALDAYMRRVGDRMSREEFAALLETDTWLTAQAALDLGLVDEISDPTDLKACIRFDTTKLRSAPAQFLQSINAPSPAMSFKITASLVALLSSAASQLGLADPKLSLDSSEADVSAQLNAITAAGAKHKADLATAQGQITALTTERDTARTDLADVKAQITTITTEFATAKTDLAAAKAQVTALTTERDTHKTALDKETGRLKLLERFCRVKGINPADAPEKIEEPDAKEMKLSAFKELSAEHRMAFVRGGGKLID